MAFPTTSAQHRRWPQSIPSSSRTQMSLLVPTDNSIYSVWNEALDKYKDTFQIDLRDTQSPLGRRLAKCESEDGILDALHATVEEFSKRRKGSVSMHTVREVLKPVVSGLNVLLDTGSEAVSSVVPGGKSIFVAIGVLLRAAERVTACFDDVLKLFKQIKAYIDRLHVRIQATLGREARTLAVDALVKMLNALMLATRMMKEGRLGRFVRALLNEADDVRDLIGDLEDIMIDEERLSVAELVVGMHKLSLSLDDMVSASVRVESSLESSVNELRDRLGIVHHSFHGRLDQILVSLRDRGDAVAVTQRFPPSVSLQLTLTLPNIDTSSLRDAMRYLGSLLSSANAADRALLGQALTILYAWATHTVVSDSRHAADMALATTCDPIQILTTFVPVAIAMLSVYALWQCIFRPLGVAGGSIVLIDALGRSFILDGDTFLSWQTIHAFLLANFRGQQGLRYVQTRSYMLSDAEHSRVIEREAWSKLIRPGMRLEMGILLRRPLLTCPWCQSTILNLDGSDGQVSCTNTPCRRSFRAFGHRDTDDRSSDPDLREASVHSDSAKSSDDSDPRSPPLVPEDQREPSRPLQTGGTPEAGEADDMYKFRQIVVQFSLRPSSSVDANPVPHGWDALRPHSAADYICAGGGPGGMVVGREELEKTVWDVVDGRVDLSEEGRRRKAQGDSWRPAVAAHPTPAYMTSGDSYRPGDLAVVDDGPPVCMADARDRLPECARLPPGAGTVWAHMTRAHGWSALTKPGAREFICNNAPKRKEFERRVWDVIDEKVDLGPAEVAVKRERIESVFLGGEDEWPVCMADPSERRDTCSLYMTPREVWAHMLSAHRWDALKPPAVVEYVCGGDTTHAWVSRGLFESRVREVMNGLGWTTFAVFSLLVHPHDDDDLEMHPTRKFSRTESIKFTHPMSEP
ncbi:unnamed protein product [Peniophora sp. CBMAI 1063]|nr:unnamed protein product [Peniophora sp. CBMAI 1063]